MSVILATVVLVCAGSMAAGPQSSSPSPLAGVHNVHVKPAGQDHEAIRFRKLLSDELRKAGLQIAAEERDADAVLSSTLSTPVVDGHSRAYAEVELADQRGQRLWGGDFPSRRRWPSGADYVRKLAEEIASALKKAVTPASVTAPPNRDASFAHFVVQMPRSLLICPRADVRVATVAMVPRRK